MRILKYVLPIALVGAVAFWVYNKLKRASVVNPLMPVKYPEKTKPFTAQQAKRIANELFYAMDRLGTDSVLLSSLYEEIRGVKGAFIQVYNAFGSPAYVGTGYIFGLGKPLDLIGWLREELSNEEFEKWSALAKKEGV